MLYLAEVKKQVKGFLPPTCRTELRLLAWEHNDKTWSAVQGEEIISSNEVPQVGEGVLLLVKLSQSREIEEIPNLAAHELVRQLQRMSRLSHKLKDQSQEIEHWKQSLTYQSEELSRRSLEIEEQMRLAHLNSAGGGSDLLAVPLDRLWQILQSQQALLKSCSQELEQQQAMVGYWQQDLQHQEEMLALNRQEFQASRASLEQSKIQFQSQHFTLLAKQELYKRLERHLQELVELQLTAERLGIEGTEESLAMNIDLEAIENMPLGDLKALASQLEGDLAKLVNFVNDQEEELSLQTETVRELEGQLARTGEKEQSSLEATLVEEREKKQMLDRTLSGQRRNLRERQQILQEHLRILRRREGANSIEEPGRSDTVPLLRQLEDCGSTISEELQQLQREIEHLQESLQQINGVIQQQEAEQERQAETLQIQENNWQQARANLAQTQARLELYAQSLQPLQQKWQEIEQIWQSVRAYL